VYVFLFGSVAKLSTDSLPQPLFYIAGITVWAYFADSLKRISTVLFDSKEILGKVYFPRIIMPLSIVFSSVIRYLFQLLLIVAIIIYFHFFTSYEFSFTLATCMFPLMIVLVAIQSLGLGLIVSAISVKYRDIAFLVNFGLQLLMYSTTVVFPLSSLNGLAKTIVSLHPLTYLIEGIRFSLFGRGVFSLSTLGYSFLVTMIFLIVGFLAFNRSQKNFIDTI